MELVSSPTGLPWSAEDEQRWLAFLSSPTGSRLFPKAMERCPTLLADGKKTAILIRSGEVRGYANLVQVLLDLSHTAPPPPENQQTYPDLEDDTKWNDGEKLEKK